MRGVADEEHEENPVTHYEVSVFDRGGGRTVMLITNYEKNNFCQVLFATLALYRHKHRHTLRLVVVTSVKRTHTYRLVVVTSVKRTHTYRLVVVTSVKLTHTYRQVVVTSVKRTHTYRQVVVTSVK